MAADDERDRLLVVHRHPREGLPDVDGGGARVRIAVGALRVDVDQAHLDGAERIGQLAVTGVALVAEPGVLGAPEDLLRLPDVLAAEAEAEGPEPHRLHGAVAGEHQQVGPGDLPAVLLLDRPEQPPGLVQTGVVRPAVERREALGTAAAAAPAVRDPVGAGGVPAHPDEQRAVVAVVGGPPVLGVGHQRDDVPLQRLDVEGGELRGVVEVLVHRVGEGRVPVQDLEVQLLGPPVTVGPGPGRLGGGGRNCWVLALAAGHVRPFVLSRFLPFRPYGPAPGTVRRAEHAGRLRPPGRTRRAAGRRTPRPPRGGGDRGVRSRGSGRVGRQQGRPDQLHLRRASR